jgi:hypothetical protein
MTNRQENTELMIQQYKRAVEDAHKPAWPIFVPCPQVPDLESKLLAIGKEFVNEGKHVVLMTIVSEYDGPFTRQHGLMFCKDDIQLKELLRGAYDVKTFYTPLPRCCTIDVRYQPIE